MVTAGILLGVKVAPVIFSGVAALYSFFNHRKLKKQEERAAALLYSSNGRTAAGAATPQGKTK